MADEDPYLPIHQSCFTGNARQLGRLLRTGYNVNELDAHGCTPLILAVRGGFVTIAFQLFDYNADIDVQDAIGKTALMYAVENDDDMLVVHLLARNANPNLKDVLGSWPLMTAVKRGCFPVTGRLLKAVQTQVNIVDSSGCTALYVAAENGCLELVRALVYHSASVHIATRQRKTPLVVAAERGHVQVVEFLVENASNVEAMDAKGYSAAQYACRNGHMDVLRVLFQKGANLAVRDPVDHSTLLMAAVKRGREEMVKFLVTTARLDVNATDVADRPALYYACKYPSLVEFLLHHNASPQMADRSDKTVLMRASQLGDTDVCRSLMQCGINVNYVDVSGNTALMYACIHGKDKAVKVLLDHGACATIADSEGQTPLMLATFMGYGRIVRTLLRHTPAGGVDAQDSLGATALHRACIRNHVSIVEKLLQGGGRAWVADADGQTPLMLACSFGKDDLAKALLAHDNNVEYVNAADHKHQTALYHACKFEHESCVHVLMSHHADLNKPDNSGMTPLMLASILGNTSFVHALVCGGADLNLQDNEQRTALYYACDTGHTDVATWLLHRGADPTLASSSLKTPLMLASVDGDEIVVKAILDVQNDPAYVNLVDDHSMSALHFAVAGERLDIVNALLDHGADIFITSEMGETPLMTAAESGQLTVFQSILAKTVPGFARKAYIDATDDEQQTAMHKAASVGAPSIIKCLKEHGATIESIDEYGNTPLLVATLNKRVQAVQALLECGSHAQINHCNRSHKTALYYALRSRSCLMVQRLLEAGADICPLFHTRAIWSSGYPNDVGPTTLRVMVKHIMQKDPSFLDATNTLGRTALYLMAHSTYDKIDAIKLFLSHGANPWIASSTGLRPIDGARTALIQTTLRNAMDEPDRFFLMHKFRLVQDIHFVQHDARSQESGGEVAAKTRGQKRQKCLTLMNLPSPFQQRLASPSGTVPTLQFECDDPNMKGVLAHICNGHLNNDLFRELQAMMKMKWESSSGNE
jgi:ankyrin repeat protein